MSDFHARKLVFGGNIEPEARKGALSILPKLYDAFVELDASQIEINPLVLTGDDKVMALDAKVILDDSAAFRHPFFDELQVGDPDIPEQEKAAKELGLNLIKLDGDVGIIGNGAGLVMSTLDVVTDAGGTPANFLDVGGGANAEVLSNALQIIMENPEVKSVLINIFGGITRCDLVAEGIIDALGRLDVKVPIVVRLDGTNAEQGRKMLADAPHPMLKTADTMLELRPWRSNSHTEREPTDGDHRRPRHEARRPGPDRVSEGSFHAGRNKEYGTKLVAGVTPGKGGTDHDGTPIFNTVDEAVEGDRTRTPRWCSCRLGSRPTRSSSRTTPASTRSSRSPSTSRPWTWRSVGSYLRRGDRKVTLIGPNCPGVISPGKANVGIIPGEICTAGPVGLVSRSGTLVYQIVHELTQRGIGQSTCVGIGGDPIPGSDFIDVLEKFEADPETELVVLVGEIGGDAEERAAAWAKANMSKPIVAYFAGREAPPGKRMGHAGAIVSGSKGTWKAKAEAFEKAGYPVAKNPTEVGQLIADIRNN